MKEELTVKIDKQLIDKLEEVENTVRSIKHLLKRQVRDETQLEVIRLEADKLVDVSGEVERLTQQLDS